MLLETIRRIASLVFKNNDASRKRVDEAVKLTHETHCENRRAVDNLLRELTLGRHLTMKNREKK